MILLVSGSRTITNYKLVEKAIFDIHFQDSFNPPGKITRIIAGEAQGVDQLAKQMAHRHSFPYTGYPARWEQYGKRAGYIRNKQMLEEGKPDMVLAIWDGISRGTKNMIELAQQVGIETRVVRA